MIAPAIVVTVYNDLRGVRALPILDALARDAAPGDLAVCIHDPPSGDDRALADARATLDAGEDLGGVVMEVLAALESTGWRP